MSPRLQPAFLRHLAWFVGTGGGSGFAPVAPGTAGSLVGVIAFLALGRTSIWMQLAAIVFVTLVGIWAAAVMELETGKHDDGRIVVDEVVGQWITLAAFPPTWPYLLAGFLVFRLLDVLKPFPADWIDRRWPGPLGVIFDDVAAGIYGQAVLRFGLLLWGLV